MIARLIYYVYHRVTHLPTRALVLREARGQVLFLFVLRIVAAPCPMVVTIVA